MFKILALIGLVLVGNVFAAQITEDNSAQNLETIEGRIVSATAFEMMAIKASVDDADREELNTSLIDQFTNAGAFSFFELKTIETPEKARLARNYYKTVKDSLSEMRTGLKNHIFLTSVESTDK
ncbi:MAG: hypothetical protein NTW22_01685 [Proteobacteria bacterium]|jgi:hypothetical protein|nr:hypothetical protein [Pseudomonadota bacterium]